MELKPGHLLMWYDDDKSKSVSQKILEGAKRFKEKYGVDATFVQVQKEPDITDIGNIAVRVSRVVGPNMFRFGVDEGKPDKAPGRVEVIKARKVEPQQLEFSTDMLGDGFS